MGALLGGGGGGAGAQGAGVLGAEWLIVYVRPPDLEQADKGAKKVRVGQAALWRVGILECRAIQWPRAY